MVNIENEIGIDQIILTQFYDVAFFSPVFICIHLISVALMMQKPEGNYFRCSKAFAIKIESVRFGLSETSYLLTCFFEAN